MQIRDAYKARYGTDATVVSRAPGRLEVLGNHVDYNAGCVLSVAVDRYMTLAASPCGGGVCRVWDEVLKEERVFSLEGLLEHEKGDWANYIKGVLVEFGKRGIPVPAFNAVIAGNVPLSAGMSSSAAFEMACGLAFAKLANADIDWIEMAKIGQGAENNYIGAKTGLLDQFSSLKGKADSLVYSDFRSFTAKSIPMPKGLTFVVVNSMVKHVLTSEYNDRRQACEKAVAIISQRHPEVKALRDVNSTLLEAERRHLPETSYKCSAHVVGELERVAACLECLKQGDVVRFGQLMYQSHESSRTLFENSCEELDEIVDIAHSMPECLGARLSGGGFGGITVHLVRSEDAESYASRIAEAYLAKTGRKADTFVCAAADGAKLL
ncbi:MAG: galactokinase [Victivallales bacterium]|nr:galactokinase [Victivallales bacterium]